MSPGTFGDENKYQSPGSSLVHCTVHAIQYDTIGEFNVDSKAEYKA